MKEIKTVPKLIPVLTERGVKTLALAEEWKVYIDKKEDKYVIVPEGSQSDFATIPWILRIFLSKTDPVLLLPSIVHDYLVKQFDETEDCPVIYSTFFKNEIIDHEVDWDEALDIFKTMIKFYKGRSTRLKAELAYFGVWLNGIIKNKR